jgi:hypothetical protein
VVHPLSHSHGALRSLLGVRDVEARLDAVVEVGRHGHDPEPGQPPAGGAQVVVDAEDLLQDDEPGPRAAVGHGDVGGHGGAVGGGDGLGPGGAHERGRYRPRAPSGGAGYSPRSARA